MPLGIDRRLTIAGLLVGVAVALIGVGVTILWPEAKGLGWGLLFLGAAILFLWLVFEIKQWIGSPIPSMVAAILVGCVIGGCLGFLFWKTNGGIKTETVGRSDDPPVSLPNGNSGSHNPSIQVIKPNNPSRSEPPGHPVQRPHVSEFPDVSAKFVYPDEIALVLLNQSPVTVKAPSILLMLFDLDGDADKATVLNVPMPSPEGVFIKSGSYMIPLSIAGHPNVKNQIKKGDRLVGWVSVTCPDCENTNAYWFYAVQGDRGWFAKCRKGQYPNINAISQNWKYLVQSGEDGLSGTVPVEDRVPIQNTVP